MRSPEEGQADRAGTAVLGVFLAILLLAIPCLATDLSPAEERDEIYMLTAYAIVLKGWQTSTSGPDVRGYNIGSVLVNEAGLIVCWARNTVAITDNQTQHGEVRLMTNYLGIHGGGTLTDYRIYTTLEPCAMCAGMMTMARVLETIWGQKDPHFGDALERLAIDSSSIGGYAPYPWVVPSRGVRSDIRIALEASYAQHENEHITEWLTWDSTRTLYQEALDLLLDYPLRYPENENVLSQALDVLDSVPAEYQHLPYDVCCPCSTCDAAE